MHYFKLPRKMIDRGKCIIDYAIGKKVLHVGCANASGMGFSPFTKSQIEDKSWLHTRLTNVASACLGVDLNIVAIETLKKEYGINNVCVGNAENLEFLLPEKFDLIVAGELIEHLNNPGLFFESARKVLNPDGKLLITTINEFCLRRLLRIPFGIESVHPDHVYYFSHTTLNTLSKRFGFKPIKEMSYKIPNRKPLLPFLVEQIATFISPNFGEGIIHIYSLI